MRRARRVLLWISCIAGFASAASAQTPPGKHTSEFDVTLVWIGSGALESRDAVLETPTGGSLKLFSTSTDMGASFGPEVHLAFYLTRHLRAEATGTWTRGELRSKVDGDLEEASPVTSSLSMSIFSAEGAAVWLLPRHKRLEPFLRAGAGWVRELTSGGVLSRNGAIANGGAGVKYWWRERDRGKLKRLGLRAEARLVARSNVISLTHNHRLVAPAFTAGIILGF